MAYKREFKANDPPITLSVKVASSEKGELRVIAGNRSLSFAIQELLRAWREQARKDL